jgi:hypothetical protein
MLLGTCCDVRLLHVVNFDIVVGAGNAPHHIDGLAAGRATSRENLNPASLTLGHCSLSRKNGVFVALSTGSGEPEAKRGQNGCERQNDESRSRDRGSTTRRRR